MTDTTALCGLTPNVAPNSTHFMFKALSQAIVSIKNNPLLPTTPAVPLLIGDGAKQALLNATTSEVNVLSDLIHLLSNQMNAAVNTTSSLVNSTSTLIADTCQTALSQTHAAASLVSDSISGLCQVALNETDTVLTAVSASIGVEKNTLLLGTAALGLTATAACLTFQYMQKPNSVSVTAPNNETQANTENATTPVIATQNEGKEQEKNTESAVTMKFS